MISAVLAKIARNQELNPSELDELNRWAQRSEASIAESSNVSNLMNALMLNGALKTVILEANANVVIPHDTETVVSFDGIYKLGGAATFDLADPQKIYRAGNNSAIVMGSVEWVNNGTGRRAAHFNLYSDAAVFQWGQTLHSFLPSGLDNDTMPFFGFLTPSPIGYYFNFTVKQTSGGDLTLNDVVLVMIEP